jgi:hypothetical protein
VVIAHTPCQLGGTAITPCLVLFYNLFPSIRLEKICTTSGWYVTVHTIQQETKYVSTMR